MTCVPQSGARPERGCEQDQLAEGRRPAFRHGVAIVGSAGGLKPLRTIIDALPRDMDAAVFVVLHYPSHFESALPTILARTAHVPVDHARDADSFRRGHVYVAPTGLRHLLLEQGHLRLVQEPRVHGHVPAGDPLLVSAAKEFGAACIGIVLSGADANGAVGLSEIKRAGGIAMVQLPIEAQFSRMPLAALAATPVDLCAESAVIAERVSSLCMPR